MSDDLNVAIQIHGDYAELDAELDRLELLPGPEAEAALGEVIGYAYLITQQDVHVITASLKLSGKVITEIKGKILEFELLYGGASSGVHNPVRYAIYEKARGGEHNFIRETSTLGPMWVNAMLKVLKGI